jgi:CheY-like chemotaxis protein
VAVTARGEEALTRLRSRPPDLVLLDIGLPEALDGWDVLVAMRRDPRLDTIPVFVFSERYEMNAGGLASAGAGWLQKPIDEQELQRKIQNRAPRRLAPNQVIVVSRDEDLCDLVARCLGIGPDVDFQRANLGEALARLGPEVLLVIVDVGQAGAKIVAVMERLRATRAALNVSFILVGDRQPTPAEQACLQRSMASVVGKQEATLQPFANMARQIVATQKRQREAVEA